MSNIATREAYGKALVKLGQVNDKVVVLDADLSKSTKTRPVLSLTTLIKSLFSNFSPVTTQLRIGIFFIINLLIIII